MLTCASLWRHESVLLVRARGDNRWDDGCCCPGRDIIHIKRITRYLHRKSIDKAFSEVGPGLEMPSSTMGVGNHWAIVKQFSDHFCEFNIDTPIFKGKCMAIDAFRHI